MMRTGCFTIMMAALVALVPAGAQNELTAAEKTEGWSLLFDGRSMEGWRPYGKPAMDHTAIASGWKVADGLLMKQAGVKGGDIITVKQFGDFELAWEWKIEKGGNNGVKYLVTEQRPGAPGHEYQMLDDNSDKWVRIPAKDKTAAFYQVLPPAEDKPLKQPGEWNSSRIVVRGNQVEHWLNGTKVLGYELGSEALAAAVADSKFKKAAGFGKKITGHIMLTDHGDAVAYRNVKVRELGTK